MKSYNDFSNEKESESIIQILKDEKVIFEDPSYKNGTLDINGDFNLFSNKHKSIEKLIKRID